MLNFEVMHFCGKKQIIYMYVYIYISVFKLVNKIHNHLSLEIMQDRQTNRTSSLSEVKVGWPQ